MEEIVVIIVIIMKGTKTINHEITPKPRLHNTLRIIENTIITMNLKKAVFIIPLKISIMIWVTENAIYKRAGAQI